MSTLSLCTAVAGTLLLISPQLVAQDIQTRRVHFEPGSSSATIESSIAGRQTVDYVIGARQGQQLKLRMATQNPSAYFNLLAPGEREVGFYNGSISGNQYEDKVAVSGDYRVRVYLMRSAARRNETAKYRLDISITGPVTARSPSVPDNGR